MMKREKRSPFLFLTFILGFNSFTYTLTISSRTPSFSPQNHEIFSLVKALQGKYHGSFDFIVVDADKDNYINYHKRLIDLVKVGGVIGYDNTIWNESMAAPAVAPMRKYMRYYRGFVLELNEALAVDPRIEICMLHVGDGITICRRIS